VEREGWPSLILAVLATWRVTHLLAMEDGPGNLIVALRRRLGDGFFGNMIDCFNCLSLWIAALIACLFANTWREWPLLWLGLSGAACLLERLGGQPIIMRPSSSRED